jgi:hypothetical protein
MEASFVGSVLTDVLLVLNNYVDGLEPTRWAHR